MLGDDPRPFVVGLTHPLREWSGHAGVQRGFDPEVSGKDRPHLPPAKNVAIGDVEGFIAGSWLGHAPPQVTAKQPRINDVVVGEGSLDPQSLRGKGPIGVARAATSLGIRVVAVAGRSLITVGEAAEAGLSRIYTLSQLESDESRSMADAAELLEQTGAQIARDML